jgi:IS5 family transposase
MKRRAAVEPVIGHLKAEHRMGRNHLKGRDGDRINPVLAAAGFNFHLLLRWFEQFACPNADALAHHPQAAKCLDRRAAGNFTDD